MAVNIGPRISIDGESEYRKQIQKIIQETKTLKSEYEKVSSAMEKGKTTLKGNAEQHRILTEQIEAQKERVKELGEMVEKSSEKYGETNTKTLKWKQALNEAETELNNLEQKLKELPSTLTLVGEKMETVGNKIKSIGDGMTNLGRAIMPFSAAATAGLTASAKSFMDFESGMSKVAAISGATGDDLVDLTEKAKEMGATTKFSATESADAFSYMAMAGWKSEQMLAGIAPVMNLAAASGEELGTVSDIVTDALTAFGLKAEDAAHFSDVLASASANANTNVSLMGESFKYAAPMAGSMGYNVEDVAVALGLMANNGIKADMAGTSLRNIMQRMAKPTKESAQAMEDLDLSLYDGQGQMYSFAEIMKQMRDGFKGLMKPSEDFNASMNVLNGYLEDGSMSEKDFTDATEELVRKTYGAEAAEKARTAAMLAGARGLSGLLAIVNASDEDFNALTTAISGSSNQMARLADGSIIPLNEALATGQEVIETYSGSAEQMAKIMQENTAGAWVEAKSAMEGAAIEVGEVLAPYLTQAANAVKDLANWFQGLSQEEQDTIVKTAALVAAAGPALVTGGKITSGIGSIVSGGGNLVQMLGNIIPAAGSASGAIGTAGSSIGAIAGPIGIAVAALAVLAGAFMTAYKNDEEFAAEVDKSWAEIQESIKGVIDVVKPAWEEFSKFMAPVFVEAMDHIKRKIDNMKMFLQGFIDLVGGIFTGNWQRALAGFREIGVSILNEVVEKFTHARDTIEALFDNMHIEFPHIPLPHFDVTWHDVGGWFDIPDVSIDWYAKAMQSGMRLTSPTIFGMGKNGPMAGGEAGNEWVIGENSILGMIRSAVQSAGGTRASNNITIGETTINVYATPEQDVEELAEQIDDLINARVQKVEHAWA